MHCGAHIQTQPPVAEGHGAGWGRGSVVLHRGRQLGQMVRRILQCFDIKHPETFCLFPSDSAFFFSSPEIPLLGLGLWDH